MKRSRPIARPALRGAAKVSIAWLITFLVLFFVALFFAYVAFDGEASAKAAREEALAARQEADQRFAAESQALTNLSTAVGFFDPEAAIKRSDPAKVEAALAELRAAFPDHVKSDAKTLADAVPLVQAAYNARGQQLAAERDAKSALDSTVATQKRSSDEALRAKDQLIADLQRQLQDEQANAAQKQTELENRIASLTNQRNQVDAELRDLRAQLDTQRRGFEDQITALQTRNRNLNDKLAFLKEPEAPDGSLLAVSKDLDLGWVDIGALNRLARGTTFRVVSGRTGSTAVKALATVTSVEPNRAEVHFHSLADRFDPPVPGDLIYNPLYDPSGERTAVLAGRFSGQFNEAELRVLLAEMGIRVQEQLGLDTDYLIAGSELFVDPETGEPLEDPLPVTELAAYKDAEAMGVLIVPIKDLRAYFKR